LEVHDEVAGGLGDPGGGRVGGGAQDPDAATGVFDDREDVHGCPAQRHRFDEVGREQRVGLGTEEVGPGGGRSVGCGIDACLAHDLPDRGRGDLHPEYQQFAVHPPISPTAVLPGQAQHQGADRAQGARSAAPLGTRDDGVAACVEVAAPTQDGVGTYQQPQAPQCRPRKRAEQRGQQRPVGWLESDLLRAKLALQHGDLMAQREDFGVLVPIAARQQP